MTPVGWTETAASERIANLRREAERERLAQLVRSGRYGSKVRHGRSGHWGGWVGRVAARIRRRRSSSPGFEFLTQPGDRS